MRIIVIGAGVAGLTTAAELLKRGAEVALVERAAEIGPAACSWWAGGMLAPYCEAESAEPEVQRLGLAAADWWDAEVGGVTRRGTLAVAPGRDTGELRRFARRTEAHETLNEARIAKLEPDLAGRFGRGLFFAEEAHLDPRRAVTVLAGRLRERGVALHFGTEAAPPGDLVVDCRGLAARDAIGDLRGVRGEMLLLRCREVTLTRTVRLLHPRHPIYVVPRGDGLYMLGATTIESSSRSPVSARSLMELLGAAYALHPAFGEAEVLETGVDARPAFPDNLPRVWREGRRVFVNGLYRHGFLLAPAMAQRAAALAFGENVRREESDAHRLERQVP